ncbi:MAG: ABC transporter ATP-binding protein [Vulcanimicrobiaceae bacterium]
MSQQPAIEIRQLTKRYGRNADATIAVNDLSLSIPPGSICGLLGPNGSGKTTTFNCLLGFARPTSGSIRIDGAPLVPSTFDHLSFVPEQSSLYCGISVAQHLELHRRSFRRYDDARARELLALFGLDPRKRVRVLSKGQTTALALVLAFAIRPSIVILDEPTSGLDPIHQRHVLDLMIDAAGTGATVLFSSHQVTQVERAADRVAILKAGRIVVDSTVDALKAGEKIVEGVFETAIPALDGLAGDPRVRRVERAGRILRLFVDGGSAEFAARVDALGSRSTAVLDLNLEDIFINAVGDDRRPANGGGA